MPAPILVTLHSSPSHASPTKRMRSLTAPVILPFGQGSSHHAHGAGKSRPMLYYSTASSDDSAEPQHSSTAAAPGRPGGPSPTPSSSGSTTSQPAKSHRTKPAARPSLDEIAGATFTPQLKPIVDRCFAAATVSNTHGKTGSITPQGARRILPYNPLVDLGNDRSSVPSPKELLRMQKIEEQKIEAKKASAAAARAAIANKRKGGARKSRGGSKSRGGNDTPTRSASPSNPIPIAAASQKTDVTAIPSITTQPASPAAASPTPGAVPTAIVAPLPSRISLKRTRSTGPLSISASAANALALGSTPSGAGSPLKAVHGPDDTEGENADVALEDQKIVKRLKSTANLLAGSEPRGTRRKTTSPPSTHATLLPDAPQPVKAEDGEVLRSTPRSLSIGEGGAGGTAMRRVASAHVPSVRSRLGSTGPLDAAARERSKRETNLPRALRDYDTRAGVY